MEKLVAVSFTVIILLAGVCGVLLYQTTNIQNQNSDLTNQIASYQNQTDQLENRINDLENQIDAITSQNIELENITSELEDKLDKISKVSLVRITGFNVTGWSPFGGLAMMSTATLTVQNFGTYDVDGLFVSVRHKDEESILYNSVAVGFLESGKIQNISTHVIWALQGEGNTFIATLRLNDTIIDEQITTRDT